MPTDPTAPPIARRALAPVMQALREELTRIVPLLGAAREVAYLDIPDHINVGDRLIHAGTERFWRDHRVRVVYRCTLDTYDEVALAASFGSDTVIALHGGGNFGTLWPQHQRFREQVLARFPDRAVVVLPQSIAFDSDAARDASGALFRAHPQVTICVRDRPSEEIARNHFSESVLLVPDMAHALWGTVKRAAGPGQPGPLILARRDIESTLSITQANATDWITYLTPRDESTREFIKEQYYRAQRWQHLPFMPQPWRVNLSEGTYLIRKAVQLFSPYEEIHTDRLHAMLLACLLQKRVGYIDNSYGKLSRYIDVWLRDVETIMPLDPSVIGTQQGAGPAH